MPLSRVGGGQTFWGRFLIYNFIYLLFIFKLTRPKTDILNRLTDYTKRTTNS